MKICVSMIFICLFSLDERLIKMERKDMEGSGIKQEVIGEICSLAEKYGLKKVILFGSRARGSYQRASDIDLAVLGGNIASFALDVEEETSTPLKFDVVNLEESIQADLLDSVRREGRILYEKA